MDKLILIELLWTRGQKNCRINKSFRATVARGFRCLIKIEEKQI